MTRNELKALIDHLDNAILVINQRLSVVTDPQDVVMLTDGLIRLVEARRKIEQ